MNETETDAIVVLMTAGSREEAARLADMLVGSHLAACVQIMPEMESIYRWEGQIRRDPETLLLVKTVSANFGAIESAVRSLHTYQTPEIIALPVTNVSAPYLQWLGENVTRANHAAVTAASR